MTKEELLVEVQAKVGLSKADVRRVVDALLQTIGDRVGSGEDVPLPPLGKFVLAYRSERTARNPATGEPMVVPATRTVRFKPSKALKEKVE